MLEEFLIVDSGLLDHTVLKCLLKKILCFIFRLNRFWGLALLEITVQRQN